MTHFDTTKQNSENSELGEQHDKSLFALRCQSMKLSKYKIRLNNAQTQWIKGKLTFLMKPMNVYFFP